jgi:type IV pilus assembly protein PilB
MILAMADKPGPTRSLAAVEGLQEGAVVDLKAQLSEPDALALVPESYASSHLLLPLRVVDEKLLVACADMPDFRTVNELQILTRYQIVPLLAVRVEVIDAIRQRYRLLPSVDAHVEAFNRATLAAPLDSRDSIQEVSEDSPVVRVVSLLISQGLRDRASDIHIEPQEHAVRIRYRIDGILTDALALPKAMGPSLASRIKVMANMDIVDRHRAQDGQIRLEGEDRQVDIRVSTAETIWGEKVVLRLLDQGRTVLSLDQLGLTEQGYVRMSQLLRSPYGMIVVSGPTGSGKTTSLYAAISELDPISQNITTIEDPVEYTFENINQIQIRRVANLTFANGLKAILRQDPDVILVGEIRDLETAEIAIQSALTGHLVLSSVHATDAAGVVQRFIEMGIEGFLISSALIGVVAQRLVRRICVLCREEYEPPDEQMMLWLEHGSGEKDKFYRGRGCSHCAGTGYRGRIGVFEVLQLSEEIKLLVSARASAQQLREQALAEGMVSLRADAVQKVAADMTTLAEVMRCVWVN